MLTKGKTLKKGVGIGEVLLIPSFVHLSLNSHKKFNLNNELKLFEKTRKKVVTQLGLLLSICTTSIEKDMINTHLAMANDIVFLEEITNLIKQNNFAASAISQIIDKYVLELNALNKPYLSARINDLKDLKKLFLDNFEEDKKILKLTKPTILVIEETSIYHLIYYKNDFLKGVVTRDLVKDSHFAILVNALNVPIIICEDLTSFENKTPIIIDGDKGILYHKEISSKIQDKYQSFIKSKELKKQKALKTLSNYQQPTFCEKKINVVVGVSSVLELGRDYYYPSGTIAMRSELIFKQKATKNYQVKVITELIVSNKTVDFYLRLFDISYDKKIGVVDSDIKISPFGLRGIRYLLENKQLVKTQLQSCFTAVNNTSKPVCLNLILPFVTTTREILQMQELINEELLHFKAQNKISNKNLESVKIGIMVETPVSFLNIEEIIKVVDFIFLGTSDLHQYMFCDERENNIYHIEQLLAPFMLKQFLKIATLCQNHFKPVFVCGKLTTSPLGVLVMLSLGYTNFVVNPDKILATTNLINCLDNNPSTTCFSTDNLEQLLGKARDTITTIFRKE